MLINEILLVRSLDKKRTTTYKLATERLQTLADISRSALYAFAV